MVRRLGLGKNNHLTYASLALNPRFVAVKFLLHENDTINFCVSNLFTFQTINLKNECRAPASACGAWGGGGGGGEVRACVCKHYFCK